MKEKKNSPYDVWFISDLHLKHANILRHQKKRIAAMGLKDDNDIEAHDKWIMDMWLGTVKRGDHVYVLGDLIMASQQVSLYLLNKMKSTGCKMHLIVGNHDKSTCKLGNMFESIDLIKTVVFKKSVFEFLEEDLAVVMCHYPMATWPQKSVGALHLYGHIHANAPQIDFGITDGDLMVNVGLDAPMAGYGLISLEKLYAWYKERLGGLKPREYIDKMTELNPKFVR